ncbi:methyltransferase type 11 [Desulfosarcina alkanivorans]|uniref:Methyltransferase type 11 n=2 Tax=Desulfosarcina alkanivorans TaxID=571177 RepID=A0A5K7YT97_9BACT|nr:methyltransferase type 11 [Desulfosarcina alkanivorans]
MVRQESSVNLQKVYSARDNRDLMAAYDQWAEKYDADVTSFGYNIPAVAAGMFGKYVVPGTTPILDAGAGTGLMGAILDLLGYRGQVGIDVSAGMLNKANERDVYEALHQMVLGEKLDFPSGHFGACQSIGVFTAGHAPASAFDELVRVLCPGGYILFSMLEEVYIPKGYKDKFDALENDGKWQMVEKTKAFPGLPLEHPDRLNRVYVYRVC